VVARPGRVVVKRQGPRRVPCRRRSGEQGTSPGRRAAEATVASASRSNVAGMSAYAATLLATGIVLLAAGGYLSLSQDFHYREQRAVASLRRAWRRVMRLLGRKPPAQTISVGGAASFGMGMHGVSVSSVSARATADEKIAFLLRQDEEAQKAHQALAKRVTDLERDLLRRVEAVKDELARQHDEKLDAALARYRRRRVAGAMCSVAGAVFLALFSLV
jgi:hypothetical protein